MSHWRFFKQLLSVSVSFCWAMGLVFSTESLAQQSKPGLWQLQTKMQLDPKIQAQMDAAMKEIANLPPAQRKQIEEMMGKQGVSIDKTGGTTAKFCVSKEMAERDIAPMERSDCTQQNKRSGNTVTVNFQCANPKASGEIVITHISDTQYAMTMKSVGAKPSETVNMSAQGKWISADCGSLKPIPVK
jgi:Protein of unknown function (DUF3617)